MLPSFTDSIFYHIYPLGMCGAPARNDFTMPAGTGLAWLRERVAHLEYLGVTAVYIGPLFESTSHGYDTVDYYHVDRRLGTNGDLASLVRAFHERGIRVILDAVLNHTGRDFFAFRDIQRNGPSSEYRHWYTGIDFSKKSPKGDNFGYEGWSGHYDLVKLDTSNPEVRDHLFGAVSQWIREYDIDGLRLDAADVLAPEFMDELSQRCAAQKEGFWLMGEVVHGDYRNWARAGRLDSVTNYELYKGLWSSFNDRNFFEIAWSLNRQSGPDGMYRHLSLYTFLDNHDVNRVASVLTVKDHIFALYGLLFTAPGIPSIYYGSEWGIRGERTPSTDADLRPAIKETAEHGVHSGVPAQCLPVVDSGRLEEFIRVMISIRKGHSALRDGDYRQIHVASEQFAFLRADGRERVLVAVNSADKGVTLHLHVGDIGGERRQWLDAFDERTAVNCEHGILRPEVPANGIRILCCVTGR